MVRKMTGEAEDAMNSTPGERRKEVGNQQQPPRAHGLAAPRSGGTEEPMPPVLTSSVDRLQPIGRRREPVAPAWFAAPAERSARERRAPRHARTSEANNASTRPC